MGRFLMYFVLTALAVFVISAYTLLNHGGGAIGSGFGFQVGALIDQGPVQDDSRVLVTGTLEYDARNDEYRLTEADRSIFIRGYDGDTDLLPLVGEQVRVSGKFNYPDRSLDAESVVPALTPTPGQ